MTFSAAEALATLQAAHAVAGSDRGKRPVLWIMDRKAFDALKAEAKPRSKHLQLDPAGEDPPNLLGVAVQLDDRCPTPTLVDQQQADAYFDDLAHRPAP